MMNAKILMIDEQPLAGIGMQAFLNDISKEYQFYHVSDINSAIRLLRVRKFDLVISELAFSGRINHLIVQELVSVQNDLSILIYSALPERDYAVPMLKAGAKSYISKESEPAELIRTLLVLLSAKAYLTLNP